MSSWTPLHARTTGVSIYPFEKKTCDVRPGHLLCERLELLELATASVLGAARTRTAIVVEHGVTYNAGLLADRAVRLAVDLGDVELVLCVFGEFRPDWCKFLAVAAPGGVA